MTRLINISKRGQAKGGCVGGKKRKRRKAKIPRPCSGLFRYPYLPRRRLENTWLIRKKGINWLSKQLARQNEGEGERGQRGLKQTRASETRFGKLGSRDPKRGNRSHDLVNQLATRKRIISRGKIYCGARHFSARPMQPAATVKRGRNETRAPEFDAPRPVDSLTEVSAAGRI